uniref:Gypsy retrotransposon integrase-like protein 1 n=1 Tax=Oryzias latipes TaxID=8090 RepID=A0A3P9KGV5_ORYLA
MDVAGASISCEVLSAICQRHVAVGMKEYFPDTLIAESLGIDASSVPDSFGQDILPSMTLTDWCDVQRGDPLIGHVIRLLEKSKKPTPREIRLEHPEVKLLLRQWHKLGLRGGVLYRQWVDHGKPVYQLVLPQSFRQRALQGIHDEIGHLGAERALHLARNRFYWPGMAKDIEEKCQKCERCFRRKAVVQKAAPMENITTTYPLELICMDYLSLEPDSRDTRNILVITDHFTKFAVAVPTRDQKAKTIAKALWENFIVHYGFPSRLLSDQGRDFESRTIKELCSVIGAIKVRTTPYHPRGNPVERFNRTLLGMLGTLEDKEKHHWRDFVKPLVHAYNCTRNDTTGYSPYELMFGRQPRLPVDFVLGISPDSGDKQTHSEYVNSLRQRLQESYSLATESAQRSRDRNKIRFDKQVRAARLLVGDRVLVRNVNIRGKHKLADRWEHKIHVVTKQIDDSPVYVIKPETGVGPHRTLHRDLLLPCGFLPVQDAAKPDPQVKVTRRLRPRSEKTQNQPGYQSNPESDSSDSMDELYPAIRVPDFTKTGPLLLPEYRACEPVETPAT